MFSSVATGMPSMPATTLSARMRPSALACPPFATLATTTYGPSLPATSSSSMPSGPTRGSNLTANSRPPTNDAPYPAFSGAGTIDDVRRCAPATSMSSVSICTAGSALAASATQ
jgi:hypothetical protein